MQVWGLPFNKISLSDLVQHSQPAIFLVAAETALDKNDYQEASGRAVAAIQWTLNRVGTAIVGESEDDKYWGEFLIEQSGSKKRIGQKAYRAFWQMQETLRIIALGLNYGDYVRYKEATMDTVIQIEALVGDLDRPFGIKLRFMDGHTE